LGASENVLDVSNGPFLTVVPGIDVFIDRVPAVLFAVSIAHVPAVLFVQLHDVGLPLPASNDPFGVRFGTVAGNSRYIKPDFTADDAYSTPFC
jgi:hypothetical protein